MALRWMCHLLLLLSASWTTVNSLECYGCEGDGECSQSPISCHGPDAYCQTSVLTASVFFLNALNIKKTCAYGERPDKVTQLNAKQKVRLSLQEKYCNTNFCNNETNFELAPAEPNNLHCYGALCQGQHCASSTAMDNLMCRGNQTKCVELAISGKMGLTSDVSMKGCAEVPECEEDMGFRSTHSSFHLQCCDSDFCNGGTVPNEDDLMPNGVVCYSCNEGDEKIGCPLEKATMVNCTGSMTSCLEASGVTRESDVVSSRVIRGCATPKTCNGSFLSLIQQFQEPQVFCCSGNLCNSRSFVGVQNASHAVSNKPSSGGLFQHSSHVPSNTDIFSDDNKANASVIATTSMQENSNLTLSDNENIMNSQSEMSILSYFGDSTAQLETGNNSDLMQSQYQQYSDYDSQQQTGIQTIDDLILSHVGNPLDYLDLNVLDSNMSSDLYQNDVDKGSYSTDGPGSVFQFPKPSGSNNSVFSNSSTAFLSGPHNIAITNDNGSASISGGNKNNSVSNSSAIYHPGANDTGLSSNDSNFAVNSGMALGGSNHLNYKNLSTVSPIASSTASPVAPTFSTIVSGHISEILSRGTNGSAASNSSLDYNGSSNHVGLNGSTFPSVIPSGALNITISPSSTTLYSGLDHTDISTGNQSVYNTSSVGHDVNTHISTSSAGDNSSAHPAGIHSVSISSSISTVYHNVSEHTTPSPGNHSTVSFSAIPEESHNVSVSNNYSVNYHNGSGPSDNDTSSHSSTSHSGDIAGGNLLVSNNSTPVTPMNTVFSTMLSGNQTGLSNLGISGVRNGSAVFNSSMVYHSNSNHTGHENDTTHLLMLSGGHSDLIHNASATHYYSGSNINIGNGSSASGSGSNSTTTNYGKSVQTTIPPSDHFIDITVPEPVLSYPHSSHGEVVNTSPPTGIESSTSHLGMSVGGTNDLTYNTSSGDYNDSVLVMPPGGHNVTISNISSTIFHSDSQPVGLSHGDFKNDSHSGMPPEGHNSSLSNISTIIYHSGSEHPGLHSGDHSNGSPTEMPSVGHNYMTSNTSTIIYHSNSEHTGLPYKNDSVLGMPLEGHNDLLSNASSPMNHSGSEHIGLSTVDHSNDSFPEMPHGGGNDSVSESSSAIYHSGLNHTGVSTVGHSNESLSGMTTGGHNNSVSNISSNIYHSDSEHTGMTTVDHNNSSTLEISPGGHNESLLNISSAVYHSGSEHTYSSLSGMPPGSHNDSLSNNSSTVYHTGSEYNGLSTVHHNNDSLSGIISGGHNDSLSNISSSIYYSGSEHAGNYTGDHSNSSPTEVPSGGHNDTISNTSSIIHHSDFEHTGISTPDHSNGSLPGMPSEGHNNSVSNSSVLYNNSSDHFNFSINGLDSALLTGTFSGNSNSSSNGSLPVSHVNPNHTNMENGNSSVPHSDITSTSNNGSLLGHHIGANHTDISPWGNESSSVNMSVSSLGASSHSFLNGNSSTMNTSDTHHASSSGISSTDDHGNVSMHNSSDETVSSSFFDSAVNSDLIYRDNRNNTTGLTMALTTTMKGETGNNVDTTNGHPGRIVNTYIFSAVFIMGLMY